MTDEPVDKVSASWDGGSVDRFPPTTVPDQLKRLESIAGNWVRQRSEYFDPVTAADQAEYEVRQKAFGELAVYLLLSDHLPISSVVDHVQLTNLIQNRVAERYYTHEIRRHPAEVRKYAYPVIFSILAEDERGSDASQALEEVLRSDFVWGRERQPYALLDIWHMATLVDVEPQVEFESIISTSSLSGGVHPLCMELEDVYPLTHDIMFARGFGLPEFGFPQEPLPYDVENTHIVLILRFLAAELYDPALELLLTGVLQRQVPPDLVAVCLSRILDAISMTGHIPDNSLEQRRYDTLSQANAETLEDRGRQAVEWGTQYHANLVAGFCSLCVRAEWPALIDAYSERDPPSYRMGHLLRLGEALAALGRYDLREGAEALKDVTGTAAAAAYPTAFATGIKFLRSQRRDDGYFGYWPEEQRLFKRAGFESELFEREFLAPLTRTCADALDTVDDTTGSPNDSGRI